MSDYDGLKALSSVNDEIGKIRKKFGMYKDASGGEEYPDADQTLKTINAKLREAIRKEVEREKEAAVKRAEQVAKDAVHPPAPKPRPPDLKDVIEKLAKKLAKKLAEGLDKAPPKGETPEEKKAREEDMCCKLKALAALAAASGGGSGGAGSSGGSGGAGGAGGAAGSSGAGGILGNFHLVVGDGGKQEPVAPDCVFVRSNTTIWCFDVWRRAWVPFDAGEPIVEVKAQGNALLIRSETRAVIFDCVRGGYSEPLSAGQPLTEGGIS